MITLSKSTSALCFRVFSDRNSFACFRCGGRRGGNHAKNDVVRPSTPRNEKSREHVTEPPEPRPTLTTAAASPSRSSCEGAGSKIDLWHMLCSIKVSKKHYGPTGQILLSSAAGGGEDTKQIHNNQPNKQLNAYLGRVSLKCRGGRAAVALAAAHNPNPNPNDLCAWNQVYRSGGPFPTPHRWAHFPPIVDE